MRGKTLLILSVLVVVLGTFIWFWERHQPTTEESKEAAEKVLPGLKKDEVRSIAIQRGEDHVLLVKKGDSWRLSLPVDYPADESAVTSLLSALTNLKVERRLEAGDVDPKAYGLDQPAFVVTLEETDGHKTTLTVGQEEPLGNNRALTLDGRSVELVSKWFVSSLDKDLDGWRSHDVVKLLDDQVASLEIDVGSNRIEAVKDGRFWRLLEPIRDLADRDQIRGLISDLNSIRVQEFVDQGSAEPETLGLDHPRYRVKVVRTEGAEPVVLEFGAKRPVKDKHEVACQRDGSEVFWVTDRAERRLGKPPLLWRSKIVEPFDTWNVDAFTVAAGGEKAELKRSDKGWTCDDQEADSTGVFSRLSKLARLEADGFDLVSSGTESLGRVSVRLKPAEGEKDQGTEITWTFFAPMRPGGKALVEVTGRDTRMSVDADVVRGLLEDPSGLCSPPPTPKPKETPKNGGDSAS